MSRGLQNTGVLAVIAGEFHVAKVGKSIKSFSVPGEIAVLSKYSCDIAFRVWWQKGVLWWKVVQVGWR